MFNSCALPSGAVRFFLMFASAFAPFGAPASAQDAPAGKPSATVTIEQIQVAFIGSGSLGGGTLEYAGKSYPITVGGLGVGGIGASKLTASGAVYGLTRLSDFPGAYVQVRRGWAIAERGRGTMWLTNGNGVTMKLSATRQGLQTALGADGVLIEFK